MASMAKSAEMFKPKPLKFEQKILGRDVQQVSKQQRVERRHSNVIRIVGGAVTSKVGHDILE